MVTYVRRCHRMSLHCPNCAEISAVFMCQQVNCRTGKIESSRLLNLRQYINLYNEIAQQASMMTQSMDASAAKTSDITASVIFAEYVQLTVIRVCSFITTSFFSFPLKYIPLSLLGEPGSPSIVVQ